MGAAAAEDRRFDVAVLGAGSAGAALVRELADTGLRTVVFEPHRVGGECPFVACIPSKSMLHDAVSGRSWDEAVRRRRQNVHDLDDTQHATGLTGPHVDLVRERARLVDATTIEAAGERYVADHVVIATGATPIVPPIDGADVCAAAIWTSDDAMTSETRPDSLLIAGGGVIGTECAVMFARYGTDVTMVDGAARAMPAAPPAVGSLVADLLGAAGVDARYSVEVDALRLVERANPRGPVEVELSDGTAVRAHRVLVSIGRRPALDDLGLEALGLDPGAALPLDARGRVQVGGSVWAVGDVAGRGEYTHLANHQARVVADHLAGTETRCFDDVALPSCMFTDPPMIQLGPTWEQLRGDGDVVEVESDLSSVPRVTTDELPDGHLWLAARRSTGCLTAAAGVGPRFDELVHALTVAVDGRVPVARLRQSMQAFPTVGEVLGPLFDRLHEQLVSS